MLATIIICVLLAAAMVFAVLRVRRKGTCDCGSCGEEDCPGRKAQSSGHS